MALDGETEAQQGKGQSILSPPGLQGCVLWGPISWVTQDKADDLGTSWDKAGDEVRAVQPLGGGFSCRPSAWGSYLGWRAGDEGVNVPGGP